MTAKVRGGRSPIKRIRPPAWGGDIDTVQSWLSKSRTGIDGALSFKKSAAWICHIPSGARGDGVPIFVPSIPKLCDVILDQLLFTKLTDPCGVPNFLEYSFNHGWGALFPLVFFITYLAPHFTKFPQPYTTPVAHLTRTEFSILIELSSLRCYFTSIAPALPAPLPIKASPTESSLVEAFAIRNVTNRELAIKT